MKRHGLPWSDLPRCVVCGARAAYEHNGANYCSHYRCQLVAAGEWTIEQARADAKAGMPS